MHLRIERGLGCRARRRVAGGIIDENETESRRPRQCCDFLRQKSEVQIVLLSCSAAHAT
jgi:hypothetical protein